MYKSLAELQALRDIGAISPEEYEKRVENYIVDAYNIKPVTTSEILNAAPEYASAVKKWGSANVKCKIYGPYSSSALPVMETEPYSGYIRWGYSQVTITRMTPYKYYVVDVYIPKMVGPTVTTAEILAKSTTYQTAVTTYGAGNVKYKIYGPYAGAAPTIAANKTLYSGYNYYGRTTVTFRRVTATGATPLMGMGSDLSYLVDIYTPGNILSGILPYALMATAIATVWVLFARKK